MKTILITGVSTGFGHALAHAALDAGHRVIGTLRDEAARAQFDQIAPGRSFGLLLDVTEMQRIAAVINAAEKDIGPVDVLVNNAGYGHEGTVEESSIEDLRRQFEVNVFGAVAMIKGVLPHMRARRSGHIINITSMGGITTFPGVAYYHGSKFALEGIAESLAKEIAAFGIHVTSIEPGAFRTDWAGRSLVRAERSIADYDEVFDPLRERRKAISGKQAGDPQKAAQAILKVIDSPNPPGHLLLGADALKFVSEKLDALQSEIAAWKAVTLSTGFD